MAIPPPMSITEVLSSIRQHPHNTEHFQALGNHLREEHIRTSCEVTDSLPLIVETSSANLASYLLHKHQHQVPLILEVTRCIVNLLADSDDNRLFFQGANHHVPQFWIQIKHCLNDPGADPSINKRIVIILGQFIHSDTYKQKYLLWLLEHHLLEPLYLYLNHNLPPTKISEVFNFQHAFEFLKELVDVNATTIPSKPDEYGPIAVKLVDYLLSIASTILDSLQKFNLIEDNEETEDDEELDLFDLDEIILNIAGTVSFLTTFEDLDFSSIDANQRSLKLIGKIPDNFPNKTHIKRKLFAVSGCISSMKSFDSTKDIKASIEYFTQVTVDPYVLAASAINLGNYITNKDRLKEVVDMIEDELSLEAFYRAFFDMHVNDVIQIQSLHLLNNLLTSSNAPYVLANYECLFSRFVKIIVDNGKYYQDVYQIFQKFVNKLIRLAFITNQDNILDFKDLWNYIIDGSDESADTQYLLLQAYVSVFKDSPITTANTPDNTQFIKKLITTAVSVPPKASQLDGFLEKLKTLGMMYHNLTSHKVGPQDLIEYLYLDKQTLKAQLVDPYKEFLVQLREQLAQPQTLQHEILKNNSKFVCATSITFWSDYNDADELVQICTNIASK
ncbi:uncharacterized protein CANTADRAFT_19355 [Suhomyces tanzawaensis NRRL Y-17324]|uniref:ARM repeat-containing protein n=1 Tax=Suhomyces tanzawaensis NRRL Y-17324 TaxID=984487 RepID=A0A1E4SQQ2_9ASCO|nr:uncharacterized protein CANTADRAFT_19355 [Suhomyces tanzawaensis NRRL Y-17324]ODV81742.1 hypothetical protein CANTADRAFT_19355 [Suhomyces tanzawaensis NRRL Y-17324]